MDIISDLAKGAATGLFSSIGGMAKDIRAAITGEEVMSAEQKSLLIANSFNLEIAALQADMAIAKGQTDTNIEEAKSDSLLKSGWRPSVGWVCVFGLAYEFLLRPLLPWTVQNIPQLFGATVTITPLPGLDLSTLMVLLTGMLGLGGMRTFEKVQDKQNCNTK